MFGTLAFVLDRRAARLLVAGLILSIFTAVLGGTFSQANAAVNGGTGRAASMLVAPHALQGAATVTVRRRAACYLVTKAQASELSEVPVSQVHKVALTKYHGASCTWLANVGAIVVRVGRTAVRRYHAYLPNSHRLSRSVPHARWFAGSGINGFVLIRLACGEKVLLFVQGGTRAEVRPVLASVVAKVRASGV